MSKLKIGDWKKADINPRLLVFSFVFFVGLMYSFTQPIYGVSDEPAHAVKAVATGHGEITGPTVIGQFGYSAEEYKVAEAYNSIWNFVCYNGDVNVTPACSEELSRDKNLVPVASTAGSYPLIYYATIGWIANLAVGPWGIYLMRTATSLIVALLLGMSFAQSLKFLSMSRAILATFIAFTPAVAAFSGTVNPFSVEVSAATLFWTSSIAIFTSLEKQKLFDSKVLLVISGTLLALVRPVSFVWIGLIELFLLLFFLKLPVNKFNSDGKIFQVAIASGAFLLSVAVNFSRNGVTSFGAAGAAGGNMTGNMRISLERSDDYFRQLFGFFGWTQFYPPVYVPIIFCGTAIYIGAKICNRSRRQVFSLSIFLFFIIFCPILLEGVRASSNGWGYQGRYILPVAVGIPFLYFVNGDSLVKAKENELDKKWPIYLIASGHLFALYHVARRFTVGLDGPYMWFKSPEWTGYGGVPLFVFLLMSTVLVVILLAQASSRTNVAKISAEN
jgi:hypothetical protein